MEDILKTAGGQNKSGQAGEKMLKGQGFRFQAVGCRPKAQEKQDANFTTDFLRPIREM